MENTELNWKTLLPESLNNDEDLAKIQKMITQWSRLVAWSWTPCLAFAGNDDKVMNEQKLKTFFIETLRNQGMCFLAYKAYGQKKALPEAEKLSEYIKHLLQGLESYRSDLSGGV